MIVATATARGYRPNQVRTRYAKFIRGVGFRWCEVGDDRRYDLRQGTCAASDLPGPVMNAALDRAGFYPPYVEWPLDG